MQISTKIFFWDCFLCSFRWYEQIKMNRDFFYLFEILLAQWEPKKKFLETPPVFIFLYDRVRDGLSEGMNKIKIKNETRT